MSNSTSLYIEFHYLYGRVLVWGGLCTTNTDLDIVTCWTSEGYTEPGWSHPIATALTFALPAIPKRIAGIPEHISMLKWTGWISRLTVVVISNEWRWCLRRVWTTSHQAWTAVDLIAQKKLLRQTSSISPDVRAWWRSIGNTHSINVAGIYWIR